MTVEESRQLLVDIASKDQYVQYQALRQVKNEIIGYPAKKEAYLQEDIVSKLNFILQSPDGNLQSCHEAVVILGSLFYGTETKPLTWVADVVPVLVQLLLLLPSSESSLGLASVIFETLNLASDHFRLRQYLGTQEVAAKLLQLLRLAGASGCIELQVQMTGLLGSQQFTSREQECIVGEEHSMLTWLQTTLWNSATLLLNGSKGRRFDPISVTSRTTLTYTLLQAISALCRDNVANCSKVEQFQSSLAENTESATNSESLLHSPDVKMLYNLIFYPSSLVKLGAITLLVILYKKPTLLKLKENVKRIATVVLPILVRLLEERPSVIAEQAPFVLSYLVTDNETMQKAACDADAIKRLAAIVQQQGTTTLQKGPSEKLIQGVFEALAAIALFKDEYRKQIVDAGVAPHIVAAMQHPSPKVRTAACLCTRSLSRSTNLLRTALVDVEIAKPLFALLSDPNMDVKVAASAVLCNLLLDFSPLRKAIVDHGVVRIICDHAKSENGPLRINAVWAIKHLMCDSEPELKASALRELGTSTLLALCDDPVIGVQEQAMDVIRNICSHEEGLNPLITAVGAHLLLDIIRAKLISPYPEIVGPAVYTCVHLAAGADAHRSMLMNDEAILKTVLEHMLHPKTEVRLACVWMVINLTWAAEGDAQRGLCLRRAQVLQQLGFVEKLQRLHHDSSLDVRERAATSLAHMDELIHFTQ